MNVGMFFDNRYKKKMSTNTIIVSYSGILLPQNKEIITKGVTKMKNQAIKIMTKASKKLEVTTN